jgi:hypothetical protein
MANQIEKKELIKEFPPCKCGAGLKTVADVGSHGYKYGCLDVCQNCGHVRRERYYN